MTHRRSRTQFCMYLENASRGPAGGEGLTCLHLAQRASAQLPLTRTWRCHLFPTLLSLRDKKTPVPDFVTSDFSKLSLRSDYSKIFFST